MSAGLDLGGLLAAVDAELPAAAELRRELHRRPELGNEEEGTSAAVAAALPGVERESVLGTGLLFRVGGAAADPPVMARAELDALPIREATGAPFAATGGAMHACGHDVHMAALVALTRAVAALGAGAPPLVAFFQPSEERAPSGARAFLATAAAARPYRAVLGAHVHPTIPFGAVAVPPGPINAACDDFRLLVRGAPTHAAYPHQGRDPVLALAAIVVALQQIVSRRLDPIRPAVVSVTGLDAEGPSNALPGEASAWGTVRTLEPEDRAPALELLGEIAADVARAHGCTAAVELTPGEPALVNDPELAAAAAPLLAAADARLAPGFRSCGSDDIAFLGDLAPLLMAFVGIEGAQEVADVPLHDPRFLPSEKAIGAVARALACLYAAASGATNTDWPQSAGPLPPMRR
ncbi:MAG: amidohydrolase [Actinobacteria bacterium]|nr:amidohydrolase [Actinomycetota bacterium]